MAIGNDTGSGAEYEVQPSSGPPGAGGGGNLTQTSMLMMTSIALGVGAGAALLFGCPGRGGGPLVLLGLGLLGASLVTQVMALVGLRKANRSAEAFVGGAQSRAAAGTLAASIKGAKTYIGPGETHRVTFAVGQWVVFCEPKSGNHLATSSPVQSPSEDVRLKQQEAVDSSFFVDQ